MGVPQQWHSNSPAIKPVSEQVFTGEHLQGQQTRPIEAASKSVAYWLASIESTKHSIALIATTLLLKGFF